MVEPSGIGKRIRYLRLQNGLTQMELADRIGVSYQQLQKYENGKSQISLQRLMQLSEALNITPTSVLPIPAEARLSDKTLRDSPAHSTEERSLISLWARIQSPQLRRTLLRLMRDIVQQQKS